MFGVISFGGFQRHLTKYTTEVNFLPLSILVNMCIASEHSTSAGFYTFFPSNAILNSENRLTL